MQEAVFTARGGVVPPLSQLRKLIASQEQLSYSKRSKQNKAGKVCFQSSAFEMCSEYMKDNVSKSIENNFFNDFVIYLFIILVTAFPIATCITLKKDSPASLLSLM